MKNLPQPVIADFRDVKQWVLDTIPSPELFREICGALQRGYNSHLLDQWLTLCHPLSHLSCRKACYCRKTLYLDLENIIQHGRMAAATIAAKVAGSEITIKGEPIRYAWTAIKREIHLAAFGKSRKCNCRTGGVCQFTCDCRERFGINCDCSCNCKCHRRTVSNFTRKQFRLIAVS